MFIIDMQKSRLFLIALLGIFVMLLAVLLTESNMISALVPENQGSACNATFKDANATQPGNVLKDSILFIIPLAPKHFRITATNWLPFFLSEKSLENVHLSIVFSHHDDVSFFKTDYNFDFNSTDRISYTVYSDSFPFDTHPTKCIITVKKWFGIKHARLANRYEFYIPMDAEVIFLQPIDKYFLQTLRSRNSFIGDIPKAEEHGLNILNSVKEWMMKRNPSESLLHMFDRPFFFW